MAALPKTPKGRVSYPNVHRPRAFEPGAVEQYEATLIFEPDADLAELREAIRACALEKWGDKLPKKLRSPIRDGDTERADDPAYAGRKYVRLWSKRRPGLVDQRVQTISEESGSFYAGCYAIASYTTFAYDKTGNKGIGLGLVNIQKVADGEPLASTAVNPEDDFEVLDFCDDETVVAETTFE